MERTAIRIPRVRARLASACLAGMAAVHLTYLWWAWEMAGHVDALGKDPDAVNGIIDHASLLTTIDRLYCAGLAITALMFFSWFYQIDENVRRMRCDRPASRLGLLARGWFVPIINWVMPYVLVVDTWKECRRTDEEYIPGAPGKSWAMHGWGVSWISMWVAFASLRSARQIESVETMDTTISAVAATSALGLITAVLAVFMVRALTERLADMVTTPQARVIAKARRVG